MSGRGERIRPSRVQFNSNGVWNGTMWGDNRLRLVGLALLAVLVAGLAVEKYWIYAHWL